MPAAPPAAREDAELRQFRSLLAAPDQWEDGFGLKSVVGAVFVGMVMTPASLYMGLVVGSDIGSAAQWVTVILFIEVARRSFTTLSRAEIYVLYYMAGASLVSGSGLLWNQFIAQSDSFRQLGLGGKIPPWVAPASADVLGQRNFLHPAWVTPIGLLVLGMLLQRLDHFGLGYILFRLTSDVEKLPFPMAPVAAQGITALADAYSGEGREQRGWRWRTFSFGAMAGLAFGAVYLALPSISGAFLSEPISVFPLPFKDLTGNVERFLPATAFMISFDLGLVLLGMVLPFWAMVGSFIGLLACLIANPVLFHAGILRTWRPGVGAPATINANYLDFYLSFGLGLTAAIAVIGVWHVATSLLAGVRAARKFEDGAERPDSANARRAREQKGTSSFASLRGLFSSAFHRFRPPPGRGDFSLAIAAGVYVFSTLTSILTAYLLLRHAHQLGIGSPVTMTLMAVLLFYGFVYTPLVSYVSARMEGIVGQSLSVPFVREATFILSGYRGAAIWFTPFPAYNYGAQTLYFRTTELTGTKITSMVKAEAVIFPVALVATLLFSQFVWSLAPVPSRFFPWADKWWEIEAFRQGVIVSSTLPGGEHGPFFEAFDRTYIAAGLLLALLLYGSLSYFAAPVFLVYGLIRGLDQSTPAAIVPQFLGAVLGRFYFMKKFGGEARWRPIIVVFFAGFSAGVGLAMMISLGVVFIARSVFQSAY